VHTYLPVVSAYPRWIPWRPDHEAQNEQVNYVVTTAILTSLLTRVFWYVMRSVLIN
jgi:hypothetical protein